MLHRIFKAGRRRERGRKERREKGCVPSPR